MTGRGPSGAHHRTDVIKRRSGGPSSRILHSQDHNHDRKLNTHVVAAKTRKVSARQVLAGRYDPPSKAAMLEDLRQAVLNTPSLPPEGQ